MSATDTLFVPTSTPITSAILQVLNDAVWKGRNQLFATTTGSGSAYTLTLPAGSLLSGLSAGDSFVVKIHTVNTGPCSLTVVGQSDLGAKSVKTTAGMALTAGQLVAGAVVEFVYDGVGFQALLSTTTSGGGGGGGGSLSYTQPGTGGITRDYSNVTQDASISVMNFGAIGDGVADDTAAIQRALNYAVLRGIEVFLPSGTYKISSTITLDNGTSYNQFGPRGSIRGQGAQNTRIKYTGAGTAFMLGGSGAERHIYLGGVFFEGTSKQGIGVFLQAMSYFHIEDVTCSNFGTGFWSENCISGLFTSCQGSLNSYGGKFLTGLYTAPNALTFVSCKFGENDNLGIRAENAVTMTFIGGSMEANGYTGTDTIKGGIYCIPGRDGAAGLSCNGVYFEGNKGIADVYLDGVNNPAANSFVGCTFNRADAVNLTSYGIVAYSASGMATTIAVIGCGFRGFNTYVVNSARKYLHSLGGTVKFSWTGCYFDSPLEAPVVPNYAATIQTPAYSLPMIQGGADNTGALVTIYFPAAYSGIPGVFLTTNGSTTSGTVVVAEVTAIYSDRFQMKKSSITGGVISPYTGYVQWMALGQAVT